MEWIEQCKAIFKIKVDALNIAKSRKGVVVIIEQLAKESGISSGLLRRWYFNGETEGGLRPLCIECNKKPVVLTNQGKPLSKQAGDYGLCWSCKKRRRERKEK